MKIDSHQHLLVDRRWSLLYPLHPAPPPRGFLYVGPYSDFDYSKINRIKTGKTTSNEILAMFGQPCRKCLPRQSDASWSQSWSYLYETLVPASGQGQTYGQNPSMTPVYAPGPVTATPMTVIQPQVHYYGSGVGGINAGLMNSMGRR